MERAAGLRGELAHHRTLFKKMKDQLDVEKSDKEIAAKRINHLESRVVALEEIENNLRSDLDKP